ncbi:unnamed protein product, partial [Phaeothamnion confervicola]
MLEYKFDYGFNPLTFLGEWLAANDPGLASRQERDREALAQRAREDLRREAETAALKAAASRLRSGLLYGPVVAAGDGSARLWARAARPGTLSFEL